MRRKVAACFCPAHVAAMWPGGFAAGAPAGELGAAPSFSDSTPKERSRFCTADRSATEGLYEMLCPGQALVFRGCDALTMHGPALEQRRDVVVRDGVIEAVRPTGLPLPSDAVVVAAEGKVLIPGLSDIHAHPFLATWAKAYAPMLAGTEDGSEFLVPYDLQMFQLLAAGITRIEVLAGCPDALWLRDTVRDGSMVGPRMRVGSPLIDGAPAMHSVLVSYLVGDHAGGESALDVIAEQGFDFAKTYSRLPAEGFEGVMRGCEKHGIEVMGHIPAAVDVEAALARGQHGVAHASELFYNLEEPDRTDLVRTERIARQMADAGTWLQATLIVTERTGWTSGERPLNAPDIAWMHPLHRTLWREDGAFVAMIRQREDLRQMFHQSFDLSARATALVHQAGGRVLTGTDYPNPYVVEGLSLHEELEHLVGQSGLTPYEAIFASTRRAAEYHRDGPADGTIREGAIADLVLLDADPLEDIANTRAIDTVLCGSAIVRKDSIHEGMARIRRRFEAMPVPRVDLSNGSDYAPDR
ncbi:amidohydrolase family protein [Novosphingobium sp. Gsoil 351]|uniref:amidohydrolase family protein n=1 Tax=Novosphingobium sp. Gsoil 351 TaxID=2675225 RepID=UPI0012B4D2CB|nr:amidohydrolase family protein [Novosphingobium sp. Gsoil 351]QGN55465.1 amidohydrolase family protein [Novosphingobium sp. Gsoil 351]